MGKVLITGGSGFIGTNLRRELAERGHDVWTCDLVHSGKPQSVRCDVGKYNQVERLFNGHRFENVYHAAAEYGRWNGELYFENLWQTNVVGTRNLLEIQRKHKFRMMYFGSAEVYGDYDGVMAESVMDTIPIKQLNDYAISKWVNELQILNFAEMYGNEVVRFRLFNVYGPGEEYTPYRGVVPVFIHHLINKMPITVYKGHKRTFEYVEDVCRSLGNMIDAFKPGEVYNLGSEKQYAIEELALLILKSLKMDDSIVTYKEEENFTTRFKIADSEKAKRDLKHETTVPLEEGIPRTIEWMQRQYAKEEH